jgi:hypothetical protein
MLDNLLLLAGGLVLILFGGKALVRGSVAIAERLGISKLLIGFHSARRSKMIRGTADRDQPYSQRNRTPASRARSGVAVVLTAALDPRIQAKPVVEG